MVIGAILGLAVLVGIIYGLKWYGKRKAAQPNEVKREKKQLNKKSLLSIVLGLAMFAIVIMVNLFIPHSLWLRTQTVADYFNVEETLVTEEWEEFVSDDQNVVTGFVGVVEYYKFNQRTVVIPAKKHGKPVTIVASNAFEEVKTIKQVRFAKDSNVKIIGGRAFMQCPNLEEVHLPNSIKIIGNQTFSYCLKLKTIKYDGTSEEWREIAIAFDAFYGLDSINIICTDEQWTINFNN